MTSRLRTGMAARMLSKATRLTRPNDSRATQAIEANGRCQGRGNGGHWSNEKSRSSGEKSSRTSGSGKNSWSSAVSRSWVSAADMVVFRTRAIAEPLGSVTEYPAPIRHVAEKSRNEWNSGEVESADGRISGFASTDGAGSGSAIRISPCPPDFLLFLCWLSWESPA